MRTTYAANPPLNASILAADPLSQLGKTRLYPAGGREIRPPGGVGPPTLETAQAAQARMSPRPGVPQTSGQVAAQAAFDKSMGIQPKPVARVMADPYDLNFAENSTGTFQHYGQQVGPNTGATVQAPGVVPGGEFGSLARRAVETGTGAGSIANRWAGAQVPGRMIASGVSNSQAAGFQQPTKANPVPVTETTPVQDVDELDKKLFAGF